MRYTYKTGNTCLYFQKTYKFWFGTFWIGQNKYKVVDKKSPLGSGPAIDLQKMPILTKKKTSFQMELILAW